MDPARAERIEGKLDWLTREILPRSEYERRADRLDRRLTGFDTKLEQLRETLAGQGEQLAVLHTRIERAEPRAEAAEEAALLHRGRERRRAWVMPTIVSAAGTVLNALLTAITVLASHGNHS